VTSDKPTLGTGNRLQGTAKKGRSQESEGRRQGSGELGGQGAFVLSFGEGQLEQRIDGLNDLLGAAPFIDAPPALKVISVWFCMVMASRMMAIPPGVNASSRQQIRALETREHPIYQRC